MNKAKKRTKFHLRVSVDLSEKSFINAKPFHFIFKTVLNDIKHLAIENKGKFTYRNYHVKNDDVFFSVYRPLVHQFNLNFISEDSIFKQQ